jgi:hypothetical protein
MHMGDVTNRTELIWTFNSNGVLPPSPQSRRQNINLLSLSTLFAIYNNHPFQLLILL